MSSACLRAPLLLAATLFAILGILFAPQSLTSSSTPEVTSLRPEVQCGPDRCEVRILGLVDGRPVRSMALPFHSVSSEIESIPADASFGHVLPGQPPREIQAWAIGREEQSIGVAAEVADTGVGAQTVLVHQTAGFDHVKRAHLALLPAGNRLVVAWQQAEGPGPEVLYTAPVAGGLEVLRVAPDGSTSEQILRWRWAPSGPVLDARN